MAGEALAGGGSVTSWATPVPGAPIALEHYPAWLLRGHERLKGLIPTQPDRGFPFHHIGFARGGLNLHPLFADEPFVLQLSNREFRGLLIHLLERAPAGAPDDYRAEWNRLRPTLSPLVYARDGYACVECGTPDDLSVDHIYPLILGGSNDLDNLQTLCRWHNSRKGARV